MINAAGLGLSPQNVQGRQPFEISKAKLNLILLDCFYRALVPRPRTGKANRRDQPPIKQPEWAMERAI